jgi:transcriptional regulator with XRE-family HTH domain
MYLREIERGIKMPSLSNFIKIVNALDISADYVLRDEIKTGEHFIFDDLTDKLTPLSPKQRKTAAEILDAYIRNL